jgi:hypothetical protein
MVKILLEEQREHRINIGLATKARALSGTVSPLQLAP